MGLNARAHDTYPTSKECACVREKSAKMTYAGCGAPNGGRTRKSVSSFGEPWLAIDMIFTTAGRSSIETTRRVRVPDAWAKCVRGETCQS